MRTLITLIKGQRINLSKLYPETDKLKIGISWKLKAQHHSNSYDIDLSAFMINQDAVIPEERYFIFYNNPLSADHSLAMSKVVPAAENQELSLNLAGISPAIEKVTFILTIHDAEVRQQNFSHFENISLTIWDEEGKEKLLSFAIDGFEKETSFELGNVYRKEGSWRFNPIGRGYIRGLQGFLDIYHPAAKAEKPSKEKESETEWPMISKLDLLKKKIDIIIERKALQKIRARVGVVLDISGSMRRLYKEGIVQNVMERLLALATRFDDDGILDVWIYDNSFSRLPSVSEKDFSNYVEREILKNTDVSKFTANNEPPVMRDVLNKYIKEESSSLPVYLIFINDGGIKKAKKNQDSVANVLIDSSKEPIFWQFAGIGDGNFDVLRKLDDLEGRYADNAGFFHIPDIEKETDEELYEKLLHEFPSWMAEAREKKILAR
ncbi:VWA domain-containing protein [Bacillus sp. MUM 13]|uniref:VWA domain-containing protein n=1 Tax=Bacillus sp. MUM 13 TaxID=1678001 RepID=UPI0009F19F69|nr:VWA domain-containing protein [Bacillus sp. MUM 13]